MVAKRTNKAPTPAKVDSRATYFGELAAGMTALLAPAVFWGHVVTLFGADSIGSVASVLGALAVCGHWVPQFGSCGTGDRWHNIRVARGICASNRCGLGGFGRW